LSPTCYLILLLSPITRQPKPPLFPYTTLFRSDSDAPDSNRMAYIGTDNIAAGKQAGALIREALPNGGKIMLFVGKIDAQNAKERDRKSTRLNSSHQIISYAVFCLKKKKNIKTV